MIKTYRKTTTIRAERFDGSDEMIKKYNLQYDTEPEGMLIPTKEGKMLTYEGDWIATGVEGEHWAIADDIFRKTYEKVTGTVDIVSDYPGQEINFSESEE